MCKHKMKQVGNCRVCEKCGFTALENGKVFFDTKLPNIKKRKKGRKK